MCPLQATNGIKFYTTNDTEGESLFRINPFANTNNNDNSSNMNKGKWPMMLRTQDLLRYIGIKPRQIYEYLTVTVSSQPRVACHI